MKRGILVSSPDLRHSLVSILQGLAETSLLKQVVTTVAIDPNRIFGRCLRAICDVLPSNLKSGIDRRFVPDFLKGKVQAIYSREILRLLANKLGNEAFAHHVWLWAELGFDRKVATRYSGLYNCIYGMEHSSQETFTKQKKMGGLCILRQVGQHARIVTNVIDREINRFPEYTDIYGRLFQEDMKRALVRKELEYQLADLIIVNSNFVKETFIQSGVNSEKIAVVSTACPPCSDTTAKAGRDRGPLIFLFVGNLSLHKGLPYLIKAWHLLKPIRNAQLWLVGAKKISDKIFKDQDEGIRYFGVLSHSSLAGIYRQADVLVLPTLLEGLAYVVLEALSYGLPVITTKESGCADFVQKGLNGFIVEAANTESLCNAMAWCLEHRQQLKDMGRVSLEKAVGWTPEDSNRVHLLIIQQFLRNKGIN